MSANTEAQGSGRGLEAMKWVVVVALLLVAIVGNYLYRDIMLPLRALAVVILIAAAGGVALLTTKSMEYLIFNRRVSLLSQSLKISIYCLGEVASTNRRSG